ncbi:hypothetical protein NL476_27480, partial [Klebsiella pneumoniae]|nr:hypothetical protein [Klebsiella pneumoniae]
MMLKQRRKKTTKPAGSPDGCLLSFDIFVLLALQTCLSHHASDTMTHLENPIEGQKGKKAYSWKNHIYSGIP